MGVKGLGVLLGAIAAGLAMAASASAATIQVNTLQDENAGTATSDPATCSIRDAAQSAQADADSGGCAGAGGYGSDTITFDPALFADGEQKTIELDNDGGAELVLGSALAAGSTQAVALEGPGAGLLRISGHDHRVIHTTAGSTAIRGVTISGGTASGTTNAQGGGVYAEASDGTTLDRVVIEDNQVVASHAGFAQAFGGGVYAAMGTLTISDSIIRNNMASADSGEQTSGQPTAIARGGGVMINNPAVLITRSAIYNNSATATGRGSVNANGGGVAHHSTNDASAQIVATTIAQNSVAASGSNQSFSTGGGVWTDRGSAGKLDLLESTLASNTTPGGMGSQGEQLWAKAYDLTNGKNLRIKSTILVHAPDDTAGRANCVPDGVILQGYNLSDDTSCIPTLTTPPATDNHHAPTGGGLSNLGDHGGLTPTMVPFPGSPAIDKGGPTQLTTDQRGLPRGQDFSAVTGSAEANDVGAVEVQGPAITALSASGDDDPHPKIKGTVETTGSNPIRIYTDSACTSQSGADSSLDAFLGAGSTADAAPNSSHTYYVQSTYGASGTSACVGPTAAYVRRPSAPVLTAAIPATGANDNSPALTGTAALGTNVTLYKTDDCSGESAGSGTAAAFESTGIAVSVADNTTTTFFAQTTSDYGTSPCSALGLTYEEVTPPPPPAPVLASVTPASGANSNSPTLKGTSDEGTTVTLFKTADCSGPDAGSSTAEAFASTGITSSVPDDSTTTFYAQASNDNGASACSAGLTYNEVTPAVKPPPKPPVQTPVKKCAKGKKLKAGKCVKAKKKKKHHKKK